MDIPVSNSLFKYDPATSFISDIYNSGFKLHYTTGIVETKGNTIYQNADDAVGGFIGYYKSRGTYLVPTICVSGDVSGSISAYHHDGVGYLETSRIVQGSFSAAIAATRIGGIYEVWLRPDVAGGALTKVFDISSSGNATILGSLTASTYSGLTLTSLATGYSIAGGTAPKTLTVSNDADVSGTNTGDASGHTGLVPYTGATGAVDLGSQTLSSGGITTKGDSNLYSNSTDANVNSIELYKSRGTFASPSVITTGDYLGEIVGHGHDGTNYIRSASIRFKSSGTVGVNRVATTMEFYTSTDASPSVETLRGSIDVNGNLAWMGLLIGGTGVLASRNNLQTTSSDGFILQNDTASLVGTPVQMSPRSRHTGKAWNTTTSASETVDCIQELLPVSGTSVSGTYRIGFSINGGAYSYPFTLTSAGELAVRNVTVNPGWGITNASSPNIANLFFGAATASAYIKRNTPDAYAAFEINNANASSTGNITNFQWQSVTRSSISREGTVSAKGLKLSAVTIDDTDSPYTVLASDYTLICDTEDGDITVNLPACDGGGRILNIKKIHENNTVTITPDGTDTIDGESTWDVTIKYENIQIQDVGFWAIL